MHIFQPQGPLFFGSIEPLINAYADAPKHEMLIVDMSHVTMIDLSGAYALEDLIKGAEAQEIKVIVTNASPQIKKVLEKVNFIVHLGEDHYVDSKESVPPLISNYFKLA